MKAAFGLLLALQVSGALAQDEPPKPAPRPPVNRPIELNRCELKSRGEEKAVREAAEARNFSDHEVLARLILAETLSTGYFAGRCRAENLEKLMEAFGWVVMNRVAKYSPRRDDPKPDAVFHVIFAPNQFRTSFSSKNDNPYAKAFLCPFGAQKYLDSVGFDDKDGAINLYGQAKEVAARILDNYQHARIPPEFTKINHFFFRFSDSGGDIRPDWAKNADPTKNKGYVSLIEGDKPCADFYQR